VNHVLLVGHSYGGMVISGVAEKMEKSILSLLMVDAFLPETGQAPVDLQPPSVQDTLRSAERSGTTTFPPRSAAFFNVNERDPAWVDSISGWRMPARKPGGSMRLGCGHDVMLDMPERAEILQEDLSRRAP
jgi:pimeloyl-ACP methyl ester carboxylesterase